MNPVLVLAATGQVGRYVVAGLSKNGVRVRAVTRDATRAEKLFEAEKLPLAGVEFVRADMHDAAAIKRAAEGCGQAYIASGDSPDQVEMEVSAAKTALNAGVTHIVKLSSCDAAPGAPFAWARHHAAIEQHITDLTTEYSFLRSHYFMQNLFSFAKEVHETGAVSLPTGDGRIGMIDARDISAVAVSLLASAKPIRRTAELTGPSPITFEEVAAAIGHACERLISFDNISDADYLRRLVDHENMSPEHAKELARVYKDVRDGVLDIRTDEVEKITGSKPRAIQQFAADYADHFRAN